MRSGFKIVDGTKAATAVSNGQSHQSAATEMQFALDLDSPQRAEAIVQQRDRLVLLGTSALIFAHEVANPLHAILGCVESIDSELKDRQITQPFVSAMIEGATREIARLRGLLRDFQSLGSPQTLNLQLVDLETLIRDILTLQRWDLRARGIEIQFHCENSLSRLMLDPAKMTQAILNLCKNGVEAMPDGGCLAIRAYSTSAGVLLEIADNGMGVPEGMDVFELFKTTKPGGSGLGLPVVRQIIGAHKGSISYSGKPEGGTTFTVMLPSTD